MTRRIRVHCEVNFSGCDIEDSYCDLPADWDDLSEKQRSDYLGELAESELTNHATSGAWVVDENGEEVS
jgi:organic radical activating enzyme